MWTGATQFPDEFPARTAMEIPSHDRRPSPARLQSTGRAPYTSSTPPSRAPQPAPRGSPGRPDRRRPPAWCAGARSRRRWSGRGPRRRRLNGTTVLIWWGVPNRMCSRRGYGTAAPRRKPGSGVVRGPGHLGQVGMRPAVVARAVAHQGAPRAERRLPQEQLQASDHGPPAGLGG